MECISRKTVVEYLYDTEILMTIHEDEMIRDGWFVSAMKRFLGREGEFYREYSHLHEEGIFL